MNKVELAYAHHWINKSGVIIKALAALEVTGYEIDDKLGLILHGKKPGDQEGDNVDAPLVGINGNQDTAVDARGICNAPGLFWAAVKDNTTVHGGEIGSKKAEEFLVKDETGFIQIGDVDTTPTPSRALVYRPGGGGAGSTTVFGRALEYIDGGIGGLHATKKDGDDIYELAGTYDIAHGPVREFERWPIPDPAPDPPDEPEKWQEAEQLDDSGGGDPVPFDPKQFKVEEWWNSLPDGILKNSIVVGQKSGGVVRIVAASATTLNRPWSSI